MSIRNASATTAAGLGLLTLHHDHVEVVVTVSAGGGDHVARLAAGGSEMDADRRPLLQLVVSPASTSTSCVMR